jgi:hypothetical protein
MCVFFLGVCVCVRMWYWNLNLGHLTLARQALYHLNHSTSLCSFLIVKNTLTVEDDHTPRVPTVQGQGLEALFQEKLMNQGLSQKAALLNRGDSWTLSSRRTLCYPGSKPHTEPTITFQASHQWICVKYIKPSQLFLARKVEKSPLTIFISAAWNPMLKCSHSVNFSDDQKSFTKFC